MDNFATVNEAIDNLKMAPFVLVTANVLGQERLAPLHLSLSDLTGDSAIVEYIGRKQVIHHDRKYCRPVRTDRSILSLASETNGRSPEVSSSAFNAQPPDLQPVPLMDTDFVVICPLVRHRMPQIRFLSIDSRPCSALLSDRTSR